MSAPSPVPSRDCDEERRRAEFLRITLESIADGVLSTDRQARITFLNAVAERMTGWTLAEACGRRLDEVFRVVDEETGAPVDNHVERAMARREATRLPRWARLIGRHGHRALIEDCAAPIIGSDDEAIGAVLIFHDVSERRSEEFERERLLLEIEASRERLSEAFQRSPSFTAVMSGPEHVFELVNDRYLELVGFRQIIGKSVREALPELSGQGFIALLDQAFEGGETIAMPETPIMVQRLPDGPLELRHVEFVYQPMREADGTVSGVLVQGIDVTERRRAEKDAQERDERLRLLIGHASDYALIMTCPLGRIMEWQGGAERITGWSEQEVIGRSADLLFLPEDRQAGVPEGERLGARQNGRAEDKRWHLRKDGSRFFGDGVMTSLWSEDGELKGYGKVVRDVTERKQAEEAAREAEQHKDEFIALLAHELRNPLAPIRNGLQLIGLSPGDKDAVVQAQAMMERQLEHMVRLIDDLLDVSRISRNKMELRRAQVSLQEIVAHAVETSRPVIEAAGHQLDVKLPQAPVILDADLTRLAQVLSNLLTNSAKYTDRGGRIELTGTRRGEQVVITVRDNGIGIGRAALPHVFDMFSQAGASIERSSGGLGIGLALVKGLVEMHGGTVTADSPGLGKGSMFTVSLPAAARTEQAPSPAHQPGRLPHPRSGRVLVVDDNVDAARSMARVLTMLGNEVQTAHDGVEAVQAAERWHPDVILMDVAMPRMNGYDATRHIRERPWGWQPVIVALTGWGLESDRERSREAGCDGHLVKPVGLVELEATLDELQAARRGAATGQAAKSDDAARRGRHN